MRRFRFVSLIFASLLVGCLALSGCINQSIATTPSVKEQVLQVIRENPEAVLQAVEVAYQQRQEQEVQQARRGFLQQMIADPASVIGNAPTKGAAEKKIVLLEFSDFQCPFCARASQTVQEFMAKHSDTVTLAYKHLPLSRIHSQALPAALAAWAAQQQGKFWEYHNALFAQQDKLGEDLYLELAKNLDLNLQQFNRDRASDAAKAAIEADWQLASRLKINATPFFLLNGEAIAGAVELSEMESALNRVINNS